MQNGEGYLGDRIASQTRARTPATLALAGFFLFAGLVQWWGLVGTVEAGAVALTGLDVPWADSCSLRWERVRGVGEWWRLLVYCLAHHSLWHAAAGALGLYLAGRAVEPIVGAGQLLGAALLGTIAGALTQCGLSGSAAFAQPAVNAALGRHPGVEGLPLEGTFPMLASLVGVYSALLPGWHMGAASRWGVRTASRWAVPLYLTAGAFGWLAAVVCALWWASGWFPEAGPAPTLAGLATGWIFTRALGFGGPLWGGRKTVSRGAACRQVEEMDWEEFLRTELNPVLEKISTKGINSLTRADWKVLQQSRRKLEGW